MEWQKVNYTKNEINKAGKLLANYSPTPLSTDDEFEKAITVLENWRAAHSYPMHVFLMRLRDVSKKVDPNAITAQRLKRVPAIVYKLRRRYGNREPSMKLYQMQDIGGCRAVLSDVSLARKLCNDYYLKGDLKHKRIGIKDYIQNPKDDGYRSIHLVYEYKSDKKGKKVYNGLRIEVQIRSKLQHLWATAVETVDFFTRQAIKTSEGTPEWNEFFRLLSSAFALIEKSPCVFNTTYNEEQLRNRILEIEAELNIISKMTGWNTAMHYFEENIKKKLQTKLKFFLLELDIVGEKLNIKSYTKNEEQKAIEDYSALEKRHSGRKDYDVVLVGVDKVTDLKKAYPNYFVDTTEFIEYLK